jgi:hypothetical protein
MFSAFPTYNPYETLAFQTPRIRGEHVYALQHAINAVARTDLTTDGVLGPRTAGGIVAAQNVVDVEMDGKAGVVTQRALALRIARERVRQSNAVPVPLLKGQLQHESSFLLGNYSPARMDGSYDAGVAQVNTAHQRPEDAFNPVWAIGRLVSNTLEAYLRFQDRTLYRGDDHSEARRWELAAGAWNAPAFANYLAGVKPWAVPSAAALDLFENYMSSVTIYL